MSIFQLIFLLACTPAFASPEMHGVIVNERAFPSDPVLVEVMTAKDGLPSEEVAPTITLDQGTSGDWMSFGDGRWRLWLNDLPATAVTARIHWSSESLDLQIRGVDLPPKKLRAPPSTEGDVNRPTRFKVSLSNGETLDVKDLRMWSSEGTLQTSTDDNGGAIIDFQPGTSPFPRAVPILIQHGQHLRSRPILTVVKLKATPTIPVTTEPGAEVRLIVSGTEYGPKIADDSGLVSFRASIEPGTTRASVSLKDTLGNQQTSTILLGGDSGPKVVMAHTGTLITGGLPPAIYMAAVSGDGTPMDTEAPLCDGLSANNIHQIEPGLWVSSLGETESIETRIACRVGRGSNSTLVVPIERSRATRLVLQSYPSQLSTDIPVAEVQSYLLNGLGERLPARGIRLDAEFGKILTDQNPGEAVFRGRYDGSNATQHGEDLLRATWKRPQGKGGVWDMAARGASPKGSNAVLIDVRTIDQGGRPLANIPVIFRFAGKDVRSASGIDGWATHTFPWTGKATFATLEAEAAGITRRAIVRRNSRPLPAAGAPDLVTEVLVPITPGRIHGVVLNSTPRLFTNDGMVGTIEVHLEDKAGNRITGQNVRVTASSGTVGPVSVRSDGTYVAQYAPPIGAPPGRVRVTASTDDGRFSAATDVEIIPRIVDWSAGVGAGYLIGVNGLGAGMFSFSAERRLPVNTLYLRLDASTYRVAVVEKDPLTNLDVELSTSVYPIAIGASVQRGNGRFPFRFAGQAVFAPYTIAASFGGQTATSGVGWMLPGASFLTGAGWRLGGGEIFIDARYLFLSAPGETLGWEGSMGGMVTTLGYKLLY